MNLRALIPACALLAALAATAAAGEPTAAQKAQARALFERGRTLLDAGRYAEACAALAESDRLAPGAGTKFNLASCYERQGRLASAWSLYLEVAEQMRLQGQSEREQVARQRGEALRPQVDRLRILVGSPSAALRITLDGQPVSAAQWDVPIPIDPGDHRVAASAPGYQSWHQRVHAGGRGEQVAVRVPALLPAPHPGPPPPPPSGIGAQRITSLVVGGVGAAAFGLTFGLALHAKSTDDQSESFCQGNSCNATGIALNDEALEFAGAATATFVAGALLLGTSVTLWLTAPDELPAAPRVGGRFVLRPGGAELGLEW